MIKRPAWFFTLVMTLVLTQYPLKAFASGGCGGHFFNPFSDICWNCFFPLTIGSINVIRGQHPDTANPNQPICHCGSNPFKGWGLATGYWEPTILVDITRHPYCLVNLGGVKLPKIIEAGEGDIGNYSSSENHSFYYFHYYSFPAMSWFLNMACEEDSGFGLRMLSELDPTWNDEKLNAVLYPEIGPVVSQIMANPVVLEATNTSDCVAATAHLPFDSIYWNAGCQGSLYPLEGAIQEHADSIQASTLISERALLLLHRLGLVQDSDKNNLCRENYTAYLPKSRYRYQLVNPKAAKDCYPLGHSTATWSSEFVTSDSSEDYGYILWKKRNCCARY